MENIEENETIEREATLENMKLATTDVTNDLFGSSKSKKRTTLDLTDEKEQNLFLNSSIKADGYLKDMVGEILEVVGCTITETPVETIDEDSGELITRKKHSIVLFDINNNSYVTGSNRFYFAFMSISAVKGLPSKDNHIKLEIINVPAKESGHSFLSCTIPE